MNGFWDVSVCVDLLQVFGVEPGVRISWDSVFAWPDGFGVWLSFVIFF